MKMITLTAVAAVLAISAGYAAVAQPAAPAAGKINYHDQKAIEKWMADNKIVQSTPTEGTWKQVAGTPEGLYLGRKSAESTVNPDVKKYLMRLELFDPLVDGAQTTNSALFDHEIDCKHKTTRTVLLTSYPGHNLAGKPAVEKVEEAWAPVTAEPMINAVYQEFCENAQKALGVTGKGQLGGSHGRGTGTIR